MACRSCKFRHNEAVNVLTDPIRLAHRRHRGQLRSDKGPMRFILGAFVDPLPNQLALVGGKMFVGNRRRHSLGLFRGDDSSVNFARVRVARYDGRVTSPIGGVSPSWSSRRSASRASSSGPWRLKQLAARIGRTCCRKLTAAWPGGVPATARQAAAPASNVTHEKRYRSIIALPRSQPSIDSCQTFLCLQFGRE